MWLDEDLTLEGLGTGVAPARTRRRPGARVGAAPAWVRDRLATTPGRLVLVSILVVVGAVCFGAIATGAEQSRERAAKAARSQTEPLLVHAKDLYTSLSDANATVATGLLSGGVETTANRNRYLADLRIATNALSALASESGTSAAAPVALNTIADQLPLYSGLVETARANNRQGFPIGAAYLRQAVQLSTTSMLPAADRIYRTEAQRLEEDYHTGSATATLVTFAVASGVALILLVLAQWYVTRISRRILNVGMLVATVAVAAVAVWGVVGLIREQNALSRRSAAWLRFRRGAVGDHRAAVTRAGRPQPGARQPRYRRDRSARLHGGRARAPAAHGELSALARRTGTTAAADRFDSDYASYQAQTKRIQELQNKGELQTALQLEQPTANISDRLSSDLDGQIQAAQGRFKSAAADATSALGGLAFAIPVITVLAAVAALLGLRQRINEYR